MDARATQRLPAGIGVLLIHLLIGYLLLRGEAGGSLPTMDAPARLVLITPDIPTPPAPRPTVAQTKPQPSGAAAPPAPKAQPTPIAATSPPQPEPQPLIAALAPAEGVASNLGKAALPGIGPGTGGAGQASGNGRGGEGDGGGGTPPRRLRGSLRDADYPRALGSAGVGGALAVRYRVLPDGRVGDCIVTDSSGSAELDETTCRLIRKRFRFEPARDAYGRPVRSIIVENYSWEVDDSALMPRRH